MVAIGIILLVYHLVIQTIRTSGSYDNLRSVGRLEEGNTLLQSQGDLVQSTQ